MPSDNLAEARMHFQFENTRNQELAVVLMPSNSFAFSSVALCGSSLPCCACMQTSTTESPKPQDLFTHVVASQKACTKHIRDIRAFKSRAKSIFWPRIMIYWPNCWYAATVGFAAGNETRSTGPFLRGAKSLVVSKEASGTEWRKHSHTHERISSHIHMNWMVRETALQALQE